MLSIEKNEPMICTIFRIQIMKQQKSLEKIKCSLLFWREDQTLNVFLAKRNIVSKLEIIFHRINFALLPHQLI